MRWGCEGEAAIQASGSHASGRQAAAARRPRDSKRSSGFHRTTEQPLSLINASPSVTSGSTITGSLVKVWLSANARGHMPRRAPSRMSTRRPAPWLFCWRWCDAARRAGAAAVVVV